MGPVHYFSVLLGRSENAKLRLHDHDGYAKKGRVSLVFDGLIYGVRGEKTLHPATPPPQIASFLLEAYLRSPDRFFDALDGQCTVVIVDGQDTVHGFRSRLSPTLIYYSDRVLSNHLMPVYEALDRPAPDLRYFSDFLADHPKIYFDLPRTPFEGIRRLLPGETLRLRNGKLAITRAKAVPKGHETYPYYADQKLEEVAPRVLRLLENAVQTRLGASDRPIVCELSGGLDSSFITSLVARRAENVSAFMYSYPLRPSHMFSEKCARAVAADLGIPLTVLDPSEVSKVDLATEQHYCDEPNAFSWQGFLFSESTEKLVPEGSLLFSGMGADQIFMRDERIFPWLLQNGHYREFLKTVSDKAKGAERSKVNLAWQAALAALPKSVYRRLKTPFDGFRFNPFAVEEMNSGMDPVVTAPWLRDLPPTTAPSLEDDLSPIEFSYLIAPSTTTDPYDEPRGVASAHPYCDSRLIEYVTNGVSRHLVYDWKNPYKNLLREAMRGLVPEFVRMREKNDFSFEGFRSKMLRDNEVFLRQFLGDLNIPQRDHIDRQKMMVALDEVFFGVSTDSTRKLLALLSYALWWRDFSAIAAARKRRPKKIRESRRNATVEISAG